MLFICHDVYALVVAQAYKWTTSVVDMVKSFVTCITSTHTCSAISHNVYALVVAQAYKWTTFLVDR